MKPEARADFAVRGCFLLVCSLLAIAVAFFVPDGKSFASQGFNWYINPGMHNLLDGRLAYAVFCVALLALSLLSVRFKSLVSLFERQSVRLNIALSSIVVAFEPGLDLHILQKFHCGSCYSRPLWFGLFGLA